MQERKLDLYFRKVFVPVRKETGGLFPNGYLSGKKEPQFLQKFPQVRNEQHEPFFKKYFLSGKERTTYLKNVFIFFFT
jgi:hypothetical protein